MWFTKKEVARECDAVRESLERASEAGQEFVSAGTLIAQLPAALGSHLHRCEDCQTFANELCEVRDLLTETSGGWDARPQPGPYFMSRVMAAISQRERELEASAQTWAAVPRLAHRVSALASITLLIAGSWLYQQPGPSQSRQTVASAAADPGSEGLIEGSSSNVQDDFLLNTVDR